MQQNWQLIATMLRRMDLEEERRNKAEEKVAETAEAKKAAALTRDPFDPRAAASSVNLETRFLVVVLVVLTGRRSLFRRFLSLTIM